MNKRLLIIGAGIEQVPAYKLAKKMGLRVVGTDINPGAPAFKFTDDHLIASTRDVRETLNAVLKYNVKKRISGVMTIANDVPLTVASVASKINVPGISVASARLASNKILMKKRFVKHCIPTPRYFALRTEAELRRHIRNIGYPAILKPGDGRGARGVLLLDKKIDLSWAWDYSVRHSDSGVLILEKFVKGPQLSVEGIFVDKKYLPVAFADRNYSNLKQTKPYIVENGGVIPSRCTGAVLAKTSRVIERAALSLGISWGTVKADIVLSKRGPQILELAARLSGNYLATHHIPMAYGVDIVSAAIRLSLGEKIYVSDLKKKPKKYLGVRYFFPPIGKIVKISGVGRVKKKKYVRTFLLYKKPGDYQDKITHHVKRAGTIMCEGVTYRSAKKRVEHAVKQIKFNVSKK
ncbi:MAG: ATP-grasp domain-containing protein [Candidatus Omnitrophota bacterium]